MATGTLHEDWLIDDPLRGAAVAGSWLTSAGVLLTGSGFTVLALHRTWVGYTGQAIVTIVLGLICISIGWTCLRRSIKVPARLVPSGWSASSPMTNRATPRPTPIGRCRVELLPIAALPPGRDT